MVKARELIYFNLIGIGLKELEQELELLHLLDEIK